MQMRVWLAIGLATATVGCGARYAHRAENSGSVAGANSTADLWAVREPNSNLNGSSSHKDAVAGRDASPAVVRSRPIPRPENPDEPGVAVSRRTQVADAAPAELPPFRPTDKSSTQPTSPTQLPTLRTRTEPARIVAVQPRNNAAESGSTLDVTRADAPSATASNPETGTQPGTEPSVEPPAVGRLRPQPLRPADPDTIPIPSAKIANVTSGKKSAITSIAKSGRLPDPAKPPVPPDMSELGNVPDVKSRIAGVATKSKPRLETPVTQVPQDSTAKVPIATPISQRGLAAASNAPAKAAGMPSDSAKIGNVRDLAIKKSLPPPEKLPAMPVPPPAAVAGSARKSAVPQSLREAFASKKLEADPPIHIESGVVDKLPGFANASDTKTKAATPDDDIDRVTVYYGTDRQRRGSGLDWNNPVDAVKICVAVACSALTVVLGGLSFMRPGREKLLAGGACLIFGTAAAIAGMMVRDVKRAVSYGGGRGDLVMGNCVVSIPKAHRAGQLERPKILRVEFNEDPRKHFVVLEVSEQKDHECMCDIQECVKNSPNREAFVFVHGYNVGFEEAAQRTAQIAHDLEFKGAAVLFSWPSQGGLFKYTIDETNVQWSVPHLVAFLKNISEKSGAKTIHLIAHSMGNRALVAALQQFAAENSGGLKSPRFNEVVLAAPDIDAEIFKNQIAPAIANAADRVTMYASSNDLALQASRKVHGYPRAGDTGKDLVVVTGIDTVDVSAVDMSLLGHDYYGSNPEILRDLLEVFNVRKKTAERTYLRASQNGGMPYWIFDPQVARASRTLNSTK